MTDGKAITQEEILRINDLFYVRLVSGPDTEDAYLCVEDGEPDMNDLGKLWSHSLARTFVELMRSALSASEAREAALREALSEAENLCDRLRLEAQNWSCEAKTQLSTVHEIYQVVSEAKGEPGSWNGSRPVRSLKERVKALREALAEYEAAVYVAIDVLDNEKEQRLACEDDPDNPTTEYTREVIAASNGLAKARSRAAALAKGEG